ncbi:hypothetical protein BDW75DRAFT_199492 [Aspergillus navahoensis]
MGGRTGMTLTKCPLLKLFFWYCLSQYLCIPYQLSEIGPKLLGLYCGLRASELSGCVATAFEAKPNSAICNTVESFASLSLP